MGGCEESEDDRTGANHCDKNLKSSRRDIFPIVPPKMSTLWRTVRKWFAENLKGGFRRCLLYQMQYGLSWPERPTLGSDDGLPVGELPVFDRAPKNDCTWPAYCLKFAGSWYTKSEWLASVQLGGTSDQGPYFLVCVLLKLGSKVSMLLLKLGARGCVPYELTSVPHK